MTGIELDAFYPYPPGHVWEALTRPEALAQWLMDNEGFEPVAGGKFTFRAKPVMGWKGVAWCEVLAVEKPRFLSWSQRGEEHEAKPFIIAWTLAPEGKGTRLRLSHEGFNGLRGFMVKKMMASGWTRMFERRIPMVLQYAAEQGWDKFPEGRRLVPSDCHAA